MPTVSVSIRNEDYDKWRALESPAEFIHTALNPGEVRFKEVNETWVKPLLEENNKLGRALAVDSLRIPGVAKASELKLCKIHGTPLTERGKCLQKGCKYA